MTGAKRQSWTRTCPVCAKPLNMRHDSYSDAGDGPRHWTCAYPPKAEEATS